MSEESPHHVTLPQIDPTAHPAPNADVHNDPSPEFDVPHVPHLNRVKTRPPYEGVKLDLEKKIVAALKEVYDPEIPVNIYELGLIYDVDIADDNKVYLRMTLTAPGCPVAGSLPGEVGQKVETVPDVKDATVELIWEPTWDRDMMSEAARLQLGMY